MHFFKMTVAAAFLALVSGTASATYSVISSTDTNIGDLIRTETIVQEGSNPLNRFTMTRVRKDVAESALKVPVLLAPGGSANFELYEMDENDDYSDTFAGYLADRNYDVWGYSPRSKGIPNLACLPLGGVDCSVMSDWGFDTITRDFAYIRDEIDTERGELPVVGGWSLGAFTTYALLNADPTAYAGAIIWEGILSSDDPLVILGNVANCTQQEALLTAGVHGGGQLIGAFLTLLQLPDPARHIALLAASTTPEPAPPAYVPNYTLIRGKKNLLGIVYDYKYATEARILKALQTAFNPYEATLVSRDIACSLAGETTFTSDLSNYTAPVYVIGSGHGFGPYMADTLDLLGTSSSDFTYNYLSDYAHGDHYLAGGHLGILEEPVFDWLEANF